MQDIKGIRACNIKYNEHNKTHLILIMHGTVIPYRNEIA